MSTATKPYVLLSKKGLQELRQSIQQLERDRVQAIKNLKEVERTTGHDDRLERNEKLMQLETTEDELAEKRMLLMNSRLMPSKRARVKVAIGSVVSLIDQKGKLFQYTLVESVEANPSDGRISIESPLGSSLLGKTVKEMVEWSAKNSSNQLRLVSIS